MKMPSDEKKDKFTWFNLKKKKPNDVERSFKDIFKLEAFFTTTVAFIFSIVLGDFLIEPLRQLSMFVVVGYISWTIEDILITLLSFLFLITFTVLSYPFFKWIFKKIKHEKED